MDSNGHYIMGIWGKMDYPEILHDPDNKRTFFGSMHRKTIESDILLANTSPYTQKQNITVYCFGEDNYKHLSDFGYTCELIEKKSYIWDMEKEWWRHKLEIIKYGLCKRTPAIYLDWDCIAIRPIPTNIFDILAKKSFIQMPLRQYPRDEAYWRQENKNIITDGCFMYFRENVIDEIIKTWEQLRDKWSDEATMAKYIDTINGGWKGINDYLSKYAPCINIRGTNILNSFEEALFQHIKCSDVTKILEILGNKDKERWDRFWEWEY